MKEFKSVKVTGAFNTMLNGEYVLEEDTNVFVQQNGGACMFAIWPGNNAKTSWCISKASEVSTKNRVAKSEGTLEEEGWWEYIPSEYAYKKTKLKMNVVCKKKEKKLKEWTVPKLPTEGEVKKKRSWQKLFEEELVHENDELFELLLSGDVKVAPFVKLHDADRIAFCVTFDMMVQNKLFEKVSPAVKTKLLTACIICKDFEFVDYMLGMKKLFSVYEVSRAVRLLDAPRQFRQTKRKIEKLLDNCDLNLDKFLSIQQKRKLLKKGPGKKDLSKRQLKDGRIVTIPFRKVGRLRAENHNLKKDMDYWGPRKVSVSGALAKRLRRWCALWDAEELDFMILNYGMESWKALVDIIHASPNNFQNSYFAHCIFGKKAPEGSMAAICDSITMENAVDILTKYPQICNFYSYIRTRLKITEETEEVKEQDSWDISVFLDLSQEVLDILEHKGVSTFGDLTGYTKDTIRTWGLPYGDVNQIFQDVEQNFQMQFRKAGDKKSTLLPPKARALIARHAAMEDVLWRYEELQCPETNQILSERLKEKDVFNPNHPRSNYGKLMERILTLREKKIPIFQDLIPHAKQRLQEIVMPNSFIRVAVLGDKSGSMDVAIRSASVISSLLCVAFNADLKFFDQRCVTPKVVPRKVEDTIEIVDTIKAEGGTSMAAGMGYYLENEISLDLVVLVSDEDERDRWGHRLFWQVWQSYVQKVNSEASLFLVSFLENNKVGRLRKTLREKKIKHNHFLLDPKRPDTSKFGALLGRIAMHSGPTLKKRRLLTIYIEAIGGTEELASLIWSFI